MKKILFVCTGNICRSAMAHHYMQKRVKDLGVQNNYLIDSCGIYANNGEKSTSHAITVMEKYGVSLQCHRATNIYDVNIKDYDLIICMTLQHKQAILYIFPDIKEKVYTLKEYINQNTSDIDTKDPWGYGLDEYERCAEEIVHYVDKLLEKF
ncbi:MAG: low molecular weight protein arginine phosphatase [Clostridia bacterium]|nr:low molecular weight protein arginine phosphatase [Clostridia bacterium]